MAEDDVEDEREEDKEDEEDEDEEDRKVGGRERGMEGGGRARQPNNQAISSIIPSELTPVGVRIINNNSFGAQR